MVTGRKRRFSIEQIDDILFKRNIKRLEEITKMCIKIKWQCTKNLENGICGWVWKTKPTDILKSNRPTGCPKCSNLAPLTNEIIDERLFGRKITRLEDNIDAQTTIKWKCDVCSHIWKATPNSVVGLKRQTGCKKCFIKKLTTSRISSHEYFVEKANKIHGNEYEYIERKTQNAHTPILIKHKKCGEIFKQTPNNHVHKIKPQGCPICKQSKGEKKTREVLLSLKINFEEQKKFENCKGKKHFLPFDFYLPDLKCCIEIDGPDHFPPTEKRMKECPSRYNQKRYEDNIKTREIKKRFCDKNDIILIEIPYWELSKVEKILKEKLNL